MTDFEKPMLISLIVVLGVILYMKLLKNLKKKRSGAKYISIDGYDVSEKFVEIHYSSQEAIDANFVFKDNSGKELGDIRITQSEKGNYTYSFPITSIADELIHLHCASANQKVSKKIYLKA